VAARRKGGGRLEQRHPPLASSVAGTVATSTRARLRVGASGPARASARGEGERLGAALTEAESSEPQEPRLGRSEEKTEPRRLAPGRPARRLWLPLTADSGSIPESLLALSLTLSLSLSPERRSAPRSNTSARLCRRAGEGGRVAGYAQVQRALNRRTLLRSLGSPPPGRRPRTFGSHPYQFKRPRASTPAPNCGPTTLRLPSDPPSGVSSPGVSAALLLSRRVASSSGLVFPAAFPAAFPGGYSSSRVKRPTNATQLRPDRP
jgi:hypothetical protein